MKKNTNLKRKELFHQYGRYRRFGFEKTSTTFQHNFSSQLTGVWLSQKPFILIWLIRLRTAFEENKDYRIIFFAVLKHRKCSRIRELFSLPSAKLKCCFKQMCCFWIAIANLIKIIILKRFKLIWLKRKRISWVIT